MPFRSPVSACTQGSAYAEFAEKRKGKLVPGYDADFILVDRNLYTIEAPALLATKVVETYVGGRLSYHNPHLLIDQRRNSASGSAGLNRER